MKCRIAIIGASGEVGYKLALRLNKEYLLNCIVRNIHKKDFSKLYNISLFPIVDISDTEALIKGLDGCDCIINTGYIWFAKDILKALNKLKKSPKHVIFTSSTGVFTKTPSRGAEIKRRAEEYIKESYTIPWTIIRSTMIYGHKNDRNISRLVKVLNKTPIIPIIGDGANLIQPIYIEDLIKAYVIAIQNRNFFNRIYNIGGKEPITNRSLFQKTSEALKKKVFFVSINPTLIQFIIKFFNLIKISSITVEQIKRFQEDKSIDINEFVQSFGFIPKSFDEGISLLISELKEDNYL